MRACTRKLLADVAWRLRAAPRLPECLAHRPAPPSCPARPAPAATLCRAARSRRRRWTCCWLRRRRARRGRTWWPPVPLRWGARRARGRAGRAGFAIPPACCVGSLPRRTALAGLAVPPAGAASTDPPARLRTPPPATHLPPLPHPAAGTRRWRRRRWLLCPVPRWLTCSPLHPTTRPARPQRHDAGAEEGGRDQGGAGGGLPGGGAHRGQGAAGGPGCCWRWPCCCAADPGACGARPRGRRSRRGAGPRRTHRRRAVAAAAAA